MRFKKKSSGANDRVAILTFIGLINSPLLCKFAILPKDFEVEIV
jgi:hypothetical protein